nr:hypothetical protein [Diaphorobacter sp.]
MDDAALLIAELLSRRWLPRSHPRVKRALVDAELFAQVEQRLAQSGLRWMDSIYADHVSVALLPAAQNSVLGEAGLDANNNLELPRDAQALLVVLWALIILPKRERQTSRVEEADLGQNDMFPGAKPLPVARSVSPLVSYKALLEDYGPQLGKKVRMDVNLRLLERHGFIARKQDEIAEGPLLDVLLDYDVLAPRILDGALADVLARERAQREAEEAAVAASASAPVNIPDTLADAATPTPAPEPDAEADAAPPLSPEPPWRPEPDAAAPDAQSYVQSVTEPPLAPDVTETIEAAIDDFIDERATTRPSPEEH